MVRHWVIKSVVGVSALGVAACQPQGTGGGGGSPATAGTAAPVDVGNPLYKAAAAEKVDSPGQFEESVVVPGAVVRLDKKQAVPAEVDGKIEVIGMMVGRGPIPNPNPDGLLHNPADVPPRVGQNDDRPLYKRLREGDLVQANATVCAINDTDILVQMESAAKLKEASKRGMGKAAEGTVAIEKMIVPLRRLVEQKSVANTELLNYEAQLARYQENEIQSEKDMVKAEGDEKRAQTMRVKHYPTSKVNGIVTKIVRLPGEYVRAGDTIMEVVSTDEVGVEGNLESSYADKVLPGMRVTVEPNMPIGPDLRAGGVTHQLEVTGVAVTANKDRPLVVSAGLDGNAIVWDLTRTKAQTRLAHGVGVRSVAATGDKVARPMIVTGTDDGKLRLWDVSNPDKLADKPAKEFEDQHAAGVAAVAFSPDGKFVASAAGRDVWVWDAAAGKKLYALPGEHKDAVTAVRFTPQGTLVTVARDRALRVWKLGDKAAAVERTVDHRKGNVDVLGLSSGGGRALFDQEDGRIDVIALASGLPVGRIQNPATAARFTTLAVFSPDDRFVLTAGGEGELQLWETPQAGGRAAERRRLVTRDRAAPTAAAFCADGGNRFVVVGTQSGGVHVWTDATLDAKSQVRAGRVASVIRTDAKTVKVRVETDPAAPGAKINVADVLQDKGSATIIVNPGQGVPSAAADPAPGGVVPAAAFTPVPVPAVRSR
jgi:hypothetical protein